MLNKENTNTANFGNSSRPSKSGYNLRGFGKDSTNIQSFKGKSQSNHRVSKASKSGLAYSNYLRKDSRNDGRPEIRNTKSFLPQSEDIDIEMEPQKQSFKGRGNDEERLARFREL